MVQKTTHANPAGLLKRLSRGVLWLLFAVLLVVPKLIALRRRPRAWNLLRVLSAAAGVLLLADVAFHRSAVAGIAGGVLLLLAVATPPERRRQSIDARARELGGMIVVNGGTYQPTENERSKVHLCVGPDRIWLLDSELSVRLELPFAAMHSVQAEPADGCWLLAFRLRDSTAKLIYSGPFAEHFARVAETTVRNQLHRELPVLQ